ncbi:MAG: hypothetical protein COT18_11110 [Elusimicrobia bacterium CG08_land_8_20_14_0_20_59_10]|nr:MAG: hypothetical protein COT18_11110 [Elusimicrobia bacterium CG08_land_8_20_14_0_20_59_10]
MAKILIIDDDGIVRDALSVFLTRAGHKVFTAADGANGVQAFKNLVPDLVVLDRDLPLMSGSLVFDKIREISKTAPVLVLSGYNNPEEVAAYMRWGAAAFLSKADGLSPVLAAVEKILSADPKDPAAAEKTAPASCRVGSGEKGRVLVADDDRASRDVFRRLLASIACEAIEAEDGAETLALARELKPDLLLLDISMPKKNGVEVLKELVTELPDSGFMMITGNKDEAIAKECLTLGAFDYVSKPVNLETLAQKINLWLLTRKK